MKDTPNLRVKSALVAFAMCTPAMGVHAQQSLEEVVVTGVAQPTTRFESSMSVSAISAEEVNNNAPRSTAEIFRNIPGIQTESTSGCKYQSSRHAN